MVDSQKFGVRSFIGLGVLGAICCYAGVFMPYAQPYFVAGAVALLICAAYFKLYYFVALEIILLSGHLATLLGIGYILRIALPILLTSQLLFFYFFSDALRQDRYLIWGIIGIAIYSIGFNSQSDLIFFIGSFAIAAYAYSCLKSTQYISLIWLVLNALFAFSSLINLSIRLVT